MEWVREGGNENEKMEGGPGGQGPVPGRTPIRSHESTVSLWYVAVGWMGALLCQSPRYDHSEGEVVPGSHRRRTAPPLHTLASYTSG